MKRLTGFKVLAVAASIFVTGCGVANWDMVIGSDFEGVKIERIDRDHAQLIGDNHIFQMPLSFHHCSPYNRNICEKPNDLNSVSEIAYISGRGATLRIDTDQYCYSRTCQGIGDRVELSLLEWNDEGSLSEGDHFNYSFSFMLGENSQYGADSADQKAWTIISQIHQTGGGKPPFTLRLYHEENKPILKAMYLYQTDEKYNPIIAQKTLEYERWYDVSVNAALDTKTGFVDATLDGEQFASGGTGLGYPLDGIGQGSKLVNGLLKYDVRVGMYRSDGNRRTELFFDDVSIQKIQQS